MREVTLSLATSAALLREVRYSPQRAAQTLRAARLSVGLAHSLWADRFVRLASSNSHDARRDTLVAEGNYHRADLRAAERFSSFNSFGSLAR